MPLQYTSKEANGPISQSEERAIKDKVLMGVLFFLVPIGASSFQGFQPFYLGGCENWIQCIKRSFEKSNVSPVVILAFDEMEVLKGLVRCNHHQAIFGGAKQISLLERITVDPNNVELISFVFQIHIIAITGEATFPLAFFPTVKANHSWTFQTMCHVIGMVERMGS